MLAPAVRDAFARLTQYFQAGEDPAEARAALLAYWRGPQYEGPEHKLASEVEPAADVLDRALPALTRSNNGTQELVALLAEPAGEALYLWLMSVADRRDVRLAPLLQLATQSELWRDRIPDVADARVLEGPLVDALACAPLTGPAQQLSLDEFSSVKARLEILLWEAGASALPMPELATWVFASIEDFDALVGAWARGPLRGRVLAARTLEVVARGLTQAFPPDVVGRALQILQPLLLHPDPLVWVHAGRALGRFAGEFEALEGTLLDWMRSESPLLRQRAITAFASLPADKLRVYGGELSSLIADPKAEAYALAAAAAATPYLITERRDLWDKLSARILSGDGGPVTARALSRGLSALWRRGGSQQQQLVEGFLRQLREMARGVRSERLDDWRRWLIVLASTDPIDGAERDPLDLEQGLENLVRLAAQYDDEEADARAARFADSLASNFNEAKKIATTDARARRRAAGINAVEGIARSLALGLWGPLLATRPAGTPVVEPDLEDAWRTIADAPQSLLELVEERRKEGSPDPEADEALEVLAVQLGGYALDACGEEPDLGPGRGPTAHHTCMWLRKVQGLTDGTRALPGALRNALSSLFWRLVDATRGTSLGEVDDVRWLGPFAAWWALVVDRPAVIEQVASALPMLSKDALERCTILAEEIRNALRQDPQRACDGRWINAVEQSLIDLEADDTELSHALVGFARALQRFTTAAGNKAELDAMCLELAIGAERLHASLEDPVTGLHSSPDGGAFESDNAPRVAALVARAIRQRDLTPVAVWFGSLGPVTSSLVEAAVNGAVKRTPAPPPPPKKKESSKLIEGYELLKPLGEGGIGSVWQVRKPGADRMFVLKIPKADALEGASETEREGILASFVEEAKALAGLYHPNVANIIDRGVSNGSPFLVLELLIGADLKQYSSARLLTLFEMKQIVVESCAGLAALHGAGLLHRDIKPANLWIRLPLQGGVQFDPEKHRDPGRTPVLATVVIDFGMVRASKVSKEAVGRFVAGTPGYIAPEQVLDPMELDGRADLYALAGTIYNVTTGRTFFDDISNPRDRIIAHMQRDPFEDPERLRIFPAAVAKLLRDATTKNPNDRPMPIEFGRLFAAAL